MTRRVTSARRRGPGAFTLVETLVAAAVGAVTLLLLWFVYTGGARQVDVTQKKLDAMRSAHLVFELLHRDLKSARHVLVPPPGEPPFEVPSKHGKEPARVYFVGGKEYLFDPNIRRLSIAGEPMRLGRFDDLTLEMHAGGRVHVRIAAVADDASTAGEAADSGPREGGRTVIETDVVVEPLRDERLFPFVVAEWREAHGYCSLGPPMDH